MNVEEHIAAGDRQMQQIFETDEHVALRAAMANAHYSAAIAAMELAQFKAPAARPGLAQGVRVRPANAFELDRFRQEVVRQTMQAVFEEIAQEEQAWDRENSRYGTVSVAAVKGIRSRLEARFGSDPT